MRRYILSCRWCSWREVGHGNATRCCDRYARHLRTCAEFAKLQEKAKEMCAERGIAFVPQRLVDEETGQLFRQILGAPGRDSTPAAEAK